MKKPELLAPAGNYEALVAAIQAGCDAVYLGGKHFGARAFSNNFTDEEVIEAIKLAHKYGVKVYVTCNTLIYEDEIPEFMAYIDFLHQNNVDAILIQDLGMLDLVRKTYPNLEIHASTQMHIHNLDGVELMEKLGLKRVVLARETPIETIKNIKTKSKMPIEVFVHGALCISYSGQCLMSYLNGGRSGNRGECAGTCRLPYSVNVGNITLNKDGDYPLSTSDLNTLEYIGDLIDLGVDSLKIEGRMKSSTYVYLVVSIYREAIDSYINTGKVNINKNKLHDLMIMFNRGYTKGFIFNEDNNNFVNMKHSNHQGIKIGKVIDYKNHFATIRLTDDLYIGDGLRIVGSSELGVKVNEFFINYKLIKEAHKGDVISIETHAAVMIDDEVLKTSSEHIDNNINELIRENMRKVNIKCQVIAKVGNKLSIQVNDGIHQVTKESIILDAASKMATSKEVIDEKINKLGDTVYSINELNIEMDDNVFVPLKIFNDLRRDVIEELDNLRIGTSNYKKNDYKIELSDYPKERNVNALVANINIYNKLDKSKYNVIYADEDIPETVRRIEPVRSDYKDIKDGVMISEIGALNCLKNVSSDTHLNIVNSYGVAFLHSLGVNKVTLSLELKYDQVRRLIRAYEERYSKHPNVEVVVYGRLEMMISKFSLNKYYDIDKLTLKNRFNDEYQVRTKNNFMTIYSSKILDLPDDYHAIGANSIRYNYLLEKDTL